VTTRRQIDAVLKRIAKDRDDLFVSGGVLMVRPVRHVMRGVWIVNTSRADHFDIDWSICHAFIPKAWRQGAYFEPMKTPGWTRVWSDPDVAERFAEFLDRELLPLLRPLDTLDAMLDFARSWHLSPIRCFVDFPIFKAHINAALGQFDTALEACAVLADNPRRSGAWREFEYDYVMDDLRPLLETGDRVGVAKLLRSWQEDNIDRLGLRPIYEPTPFPVELQPP
jgi:hypothetical protein